jgi:hypothetical protein
VTKCENQLSSVEFRHDNPFHIQRNAKFESGANSARAQVTEKSIEKHIVDPLPPISKPKKPAEDSFIPAIKD